MGSCKMCAPLGGSSLYRGLVSCDIAPKQLIGQELLAGMETQGIKGTKFQEDMTVLASTLKGKYLSYITGLNHPDNRIPVKFANPCPVLIWGSFSGCPGTFISLSSHSYQFPQFSTLSLPGLLPSAWEVGRSGSCDWVYPTHRARSQLVVLLSGLCTS